MSTDSPVTYDYTPTPVQARAHQTLVDELLFGGAAGGGKSRWGRAEAFRMAVLVPGSRTIIFRRTFGDLERSVVEPLKEEIPEDVATYNNTLRIWRFKNGSIIELSYLDKRDDVLRYQGAEYTLVIFEELTHFTEFQYTYMLSRLRAGGRVKARLEELGWRPRVVSTTNPGGPGHHFVKRRFVDPAPAGTPFRMPTTPDDPNPLVRCYIPARVADNPHVNADYRANLEALKGGLKKALLDGDWNVLEGVRFDQWRESIHVVAPEDLPEALRPENLWQYPRAVGVDYGLSAPFSAHWGARLPNGTVIVYRELYEAGLTPRQQAEKIAASEIPDERRPERPIPIVLDPSMWAKAPDQPLAPIKSDQPPAGSIARAYWDVFGNQVGKARNDRIGGWALIDDLLTVREDGLPRLLVLNTCRNLIRTLPSIQRDPKRPEDLDTHAEDHALDSVRYLCMELAGRGQDPPKNAADWYGSAKVSTVTGDLGRLDF